MKKVVVIIDLQFGSTGKGQVAGLVGREWCPDTVISANGPNAGHTLRLGDKVYVNTVLPCSAVLPGVRNILLGPGSIIDPDRLLLEIKEAGDALKGKVLIIHPNASIVTQEHRDTERKGMIHIGSTMKGTAEAVIQKMRRQRPDNTAKTLLSHHIRPDFTKEVSEAGLWLFVNHDSYDSAIDSSERMLIEGSQGHSLGMHERFYPYCTSRDVSVHQILADCRIPRLESQNLTVVGVCRTYPIRVANRFDKDGNQVGTSGGCYPDQQEITWESIGRAPELTTVTRLPRRLFTFSTQQILEACRVNRPNMLALTFCDYLGPNPGLGSALSDSVFALIRRIEVAASVPVTIVGYGPKDSDFYRTQASSQAIHAGAMRHITEDLSWARG